MGKKKKSHYKQQAKIGDQVIDLESKEIGTIKRIDNVCNIRDNDRSVNEYYVKWGRGGGWTRHDSYYFDNKIPDPGNEHNPPQEKVTVVHLTNTLKVLYGKRNKKSGD